MVNKMTGNTVLSSCKNCGLDITKNDVESRTEAIECVEYHIGELQDQIKALHAKKALLTSEVEQLKSGFCDDCGHEYKAQSLAVETAQLRAELKGFMEAV
jgi:predicted RNase H-like nuclease (RuvC/YqgF family)